MGDTQPEIDRANKILTNAIRGFIGRPFTQSEVDRMREILAETSKRIKREFHIDVPRLTVVVLKRLRVIECFNADLDGKAIQQVVINLTRKYPNLTPAELAEGIAWAYPTYRPDITGTKTKQ